MAKKNTKLNLIDLDAVGEAERFGALAISQRSKHHGARMLKCGLTTAQARVLVESATDIFHMLKRVKKVRAGKTTLAFSEHDGKQIVEMKGMKRALAHC
jgi:hypothetical protein